MPSQVRTRSSRKTLVSPQEESLQQCCCDCPHSVLIEYAVHLVISPGVSPDLPPVDKDLALPVHGPEIQQNAEPFPIVWHLESAPIPHAREVPPNACS